MCKYQVNYDVVKSGYYGNHKNNGIYYGEDVHSCIFITMNDDQIIGGELKFYTEKKYNNFYDYLNISKYNENSVELDTNMVVLVDGNLLISHQPMFGFGERNIIQVNFGCN
jgi:hypothetical protein